MDILLTVLGWMLVVCGLIAGVWILGSKTSGGSAAAASAGGIVKGMGLFMVMGSVLLAGYLLK